MGGGVSGTKYAAEILLFVFSRFAPSRYVPTARPAHHFCFRDSDIRETMMKIILPPAIQRWADRQDCGEEEQLDTIIPGGPVGNPVGPAGPSACTFWCAVAMGALAKGRPIESVSGVCPTLIPQCIK